MYGQDEWNVRQDDIYQPDLSDKPKRKRRVVSGQRLEADFCLDSAQDL